MEQHPTVAHQETRNERHNAIALAVFGIIVLALAALGASSNFAGGVWVAFCAGILGMAATFEGIPHEHWRRSAAIFAAGITLVMVCVKLFSLDLSFIVYKTVAYLVLTAGLAAMAIGMKGYARDFSAFFAVTAGMVLTAIITIAAALLSLATRTISYDVATAVIAVCTLAFSGAVTVTALNFDQGGGANVSAAGGGWQSKQG